MYDLVIVGAGPAGSIAAIVAARAGARVLLLDRARFPRDKMCGDTINPGAMAILRRLGLRGAESGLPVAGMLVTGPGRARVEARYPPGTIGRAILRRDFDSALLASAAEAGADVQDGALVQEPIVDASTQIVRGVRARTAGGGILQVPARVVIAADGRESRLARRLQLAGHPRAPRRWAVGGYFENVANLTALGEMHVRPGLYIGVAPLPGGLTNACVVTADRGRLQRASAFLDEIVRADIELADRFASARRVERPMCLGPLAVDCRAAGCPGLLLAGDAAGFIDPMTGDGLRFAMRGAELAAAEALRMLETGGADGHLRLRDARRREFHGKWRFNRALRQMAGSAGALRIAVGISRLTPWPVGRLVAYAGDLSAA
jgi:geranylgeranyl reductase family protein